MEIIKFLQSFSNPFLNIFFEAVTVLGEQALFMVIIIFLYWCFNKKAAFKIAFILLFSSVLNGAIKDTIREQRPIGTNGIFSLMTKTATGFSFPSGHTQGTTTFWGTLMLYYKKTYIYILGIILIIMVGISRMYLGVHWPIDVLAGLIFGILSLYLASKILKLVSLKNNNFYVLILLIPSVVGLLFFPSSDYVKAVALSLSICVGFILEDIYIKFIEISNPIKQALKLLVGISGAVVIMVFLKALIPDNNLTVFIRYCLLGFWITFAAPYAFVKLSLSEQEKA